MGGEIGEVNTGGVPAEAPLQPQPPAEAVYTAGAAEPATVEQPQAQEAVRQRLDAKDILAAGDPKAVLEMYHRAAKEQGADRADLQLTVGERLIQLGDVENGMKFTLLGEETRNVDRAGRIAEFQRDTADVLKRGFDRYDEATIAFGTAVSRLESHSGQISRGAQRMGEAADQIGRATPRFAEAAQVISSAAGRLSR